MLLLNETAIVTGAGSPIGRAIAIVIASEGGKVVATDIAAERGESTVHDIVASGGIASFFPADLSDPNSAQQLFDFAREALGQVTLFVHCASPNHFGKNLAHLEEKDWAQMFGVNLFAAFRLGRLLGDHMVEQRLRGRMLLITSLHANSIRGVPHYSSAKSGLTMLMRELAADLGPSGIRVNAIAPGMIAQTALPVHEPFARAAALRRIGTPYELANTAVAILSERFGSFVSGTVVTVDGGLSLFNWMMPSA